jgi:hypothetical protein
MLLPKFYIYYDQPTGNILSVTNEKSVTLEYGVEITYEEFEKLASGRERFADWRIGYTRSADNKTALGLVPAETHGYTFKNKAFEWIVNAPTEDTELIVAWNGTAKTWTFTLSDACYERIVAGSVPSNLMFFVMLADDFDFLIRTILVDVQDLIANRIATVPFNSNIETKIDKISIASKLLFESYGLIINE